MNKEIYDIVKDISEKGIADGTVGMSEKEWQDVINSGTKESDWRIYTDKIKSITEQYQHTAQTELDTPHCGGTDWQFADKVAPIFEEILQTTGAESILEFGFNAGASALMFLMLDNQLEYTSIDIVDAPKSAAYLGNKYAFELIITDSQTFNAPYIYDLVFIDADHSEEAVMKDIDAAMTAHPKWILFDDVLHPSHKYIYDIIKADSRLEIVKLWELPECWEGLSMALCKVKI